MLLTAIAPARISELTRLSFKRCFNEAIPSLFILMILSQILTRTGITEAAGALLSPIIMPLFGIRKELCGAFLTGINSGFPNGAHSVGLMYSKGKCSKSEAEYCLALSNNCSMPFFTAVIGVKVLKNTKLGIILAFSNIICIVIESVIFRCFLKTSIKSNKYMCPPLPINKKVDFSDAICQSITSSCTSAVYIAGFITFFYVISTLLSGFLKLSSTANCILTGFFELFSGVLSVDFNNTYINIALCSAMSGFSGLSVIFQVTEAAQRYGLSANKFILTRMLNIFLMPTTSLLITGFLHNEPITAFSKGINNLQSGNDSVIGTVILYAVTFTAAMIILFCIYKKSSAVKKVVLCKIKYK